MSGNYPKIRAFICVLIFLFCLPLAGFAAVADTKIDLYLIHDLKMGANGAFKISKGDWFLFNQYQVVQLTRPLTRGF